ncbi:FAD-dependent oxidoreductase [Sphingomonas sp. 37zxx]|uniref:FAD-dependent oxidoreductase n=1 Tax=Sphingomonas sp. 37zxx TaxID=1550073 RepID=UPI00053BDB7B|nr:FAD-dependent oxidoreductase [Sphingomonas sp. 37zxx]
MKADRRTFLGVGAGAVAAAGAGAAYAFREPALPQGALLGADLERGHRLRKGGFPAPTMFDDAGIVIAGGGVAGLAAGWVLNEAGYRDFRLLELEDVAGGNARSGRNAVSAYPLGAHYLPIANVEARALHKLLTRLGIITGEQDGLPVYDPQQLCADLQERLFWRGRWHEGLVPTTGLTAEDQRQLVGFGAEMAAFSAATGSDGRPAFATPIAYSSGDAQWRSLDRIGFGQWLDERGYTSPVLRAHVRYATRDDYGTEPEDVSAWAGIHYFAGRRGHAAGDAGDNVLTWPGGNGRLTQAMAAAFPDNIATGRIVHAIERQGDGAFHVDHFDVGEGVTYRTRAAAVIAAMPLFVAKRICAELPDTAACSYAPWLVANITVSRLPGGAGVPLAWDNVSTTSESLGYVVATHQSRALGAESVLSWYLPLSNMTPANGRRLLLERPADEWKRIVRDDLLAMHPDMADAITGIELWRWGHAMARPVPGYVWGAAKTFAPEPPLYLAHSDLSGLSIFEEAHYHGTRAAEAAMARIGHAHEALT